MDNLTLYHILDALDAQAIQITAIQAQLDDVIGNLNGIATNTTAPIVTIAGQPIQVYT